MTTRSLRLARRISRPVLGFALPLLAMLITAFASAPAVADEKLELQQLRRRLDQMKRDLAKTEGTRAEAADQLRAAETSISDTNRKMRQIGARQTDVRKTLRGLEGDIRQLEGDIGGRSQNLSRFLYARYPRSMEPTGRDSPTSGARLF